MLPLKVGAWAVNLTALSNSHRYQNSQKKWGRATQNSGPATPKFIKKMITWVNSRGAGFDPLTPPQQIPKGTNALTILLVNLPSKPLYKPIFSMRWGIRVCTQFKVDPLQVVTPLVVQRGVRNHDLSNFSRGPDFHFVSF